MKILFILFISIFFLNPTGYCSSVKDTITIPARVKAYRFNADNTSLDSMGIDTALTRIEIYNPPFRDEALQVFLGNLGDPYQSVIYSQRSAYPDFLFSNYVNYDLHKPENTIYYKAWTPYTEISYFTGGPKSRQEQKLNVIHTQNINKSVNVSFLGDFNYSDGQYINQLMKLHAYSLSSSYQGKRYNIFGSINYNLLQHHENGGIYNNDSAFNPSQKAEVVPVNLNYAVSSVRNQNISFQQRFYLTGSYKSDSLHANSKWNEVVSIIHQFHYDRNSRSYTDQMKTAHTDIPSLMDSNYYRHIYIDATKTNDSAYFRRIENIFQLAINTNQWLNVPAELRFGIKNQIDKYSYSVPINADSIKNVLGNYGRNGTTSINNSFIGSLTNRFSKTIRWGAFAEYFFSDYKANDLEFGGDIEKSIWGNFILKVSDHFSSTKPGYFIHDYESNHIQWHNSFNQQQVNSLRGGLYLKKFKFSIEAQYDNLNNFVYFDTAALPKVASNKFSASSLTVNKLIDWGIFHTNFRLTLQRSGDTAALPLPLFSGFNSTYIEVLMFKKVLKFQLGFDVFYNSAFYANAYMPVTGMFYSQHKQLIGNYNYPFTNVFLNIKVKRLCFFLEYEQINSLDTSQRGFFLPHYPYNPGILKYGLSWKFYD